MNDSTLGGRARTFDRWISPDPLGHAASMDLYSYASGDPVNGLDPDGRCVAKAADEISLDYVTL